MFDVDMARLRRIEFIIYYELKLSYNQKDIKVILVHTSSITGVIRYEYLWYLVIRVFAAAPSRGY